jgi:steroid delta-isomerase
MMWARWIAVACLLASWTGARAMAAEDPGPGIRAALEQWRQDFNARRAEHICDLFAPELRYNFQGLPEQNYDQLCVRLHRALDDTSQTYHNDLRIEEVLWSGDLAVVRLVWTSTVTDKDGKKTVEDEPGLDVFGRQPDGGWKIIRYIAYPDLR